MALSLSLPRRNHRARPLLSPSLLDDRRRIGANDDGREPNEPRRGKMKRMENPITKWTNFLRRWIQIEFRAGLTLTGTDFAPVLLPRFRHASLRSRTSVFKGFFHGFKYIKSVSLIENFPIRIRYVSRNEIFDLKLIVKHASKIRVVVFLKGMIKGERETKRD